MKTPGGGDPHRSDLQTPSLPKQSLTPARVLGITAALLAAIICLLIFRFGSLGAAAAYLGGERLTISAGTAAAAHSHEPDVRHFSFTVRNSGAHPVRIIGFKSTCTCVSGDRLPVAIPAGQERKLSVAVQLDPGQTRIEETVVWFTDYAEKPRLIRRLTASVE